MSNHRTLLGRLALGFQHLPDSRLCLPRVLSRGSLSFRSFVVGRQSNLRGDPVRPELFSLAAQWLVWHALCLHFLRLRPRLSGLLVHRHREERLSDLSRHPQHYGFSDRFYRKPDRLFRMALVMVTASLAAGCATTHHHPVVRPAPVLHLPAPPTVRPMILATHWYFPSSPVARIQSRQQPFLEPQSPKRLPLHPRIRVLPMIPVPQKTFPIHLEQMKVIAPPPANPWHCLPTKPACTGEGKPSVSWWKCVRSPAGTVSRKGTTHGH